MPLHNFSTHRPKPIRTISETLYHSGQRYAPHAGIAADPCACAETTAVSLLGYVTRGGGCSLRRFHRICAVQLSLKPPVPVFGGFVASNAGDHECYSAMLTAADSGGLQGLSGQAITTNCASLEQQTAAVLSGLPQGAVRSCSGLCELPLQGATSRSTEVGVLQWPHAG